MSMIRKTLTVLATGLLAVAGSIVLPGAPASADIARAALNGGCRENYKGGAWDATVCTQGAVTSKNHTNAQGIIIDHPSNCGTYRAYVVDVYGGNRLVRSTARKSCNVGAATTGDVYWSELAHDSSGYTAKVVARLIAWDTAGRQILVIDSPPEFLREF